LEGGIVDGMKDRETAQVSECLRGRRSVITLESPRYPSSLRKIERPPDSLWIVGDAGALDGGISIVGARKATPYGRGCARRFARLAASLGVTVVSGGAYGCDAEAHRGALEAGGKTVAVFGGGCDQPYPKKNLALFQDILDAHGAIVSEHEWDVPPLPWMFRERNRIIAGLTKATLVVEAGLPSGTFSTADEALAAGRDVFAVPGAITSPTSAGANRLIAQGAAPIVDDECFEDLLSSLYGTLRHQDAGNPGPIPDDALLAALMVEPMRPAEMLERGLSYSPASLQVTLAGYERRGIIARYPDGRYGPSQNWVLR
jgi:DNA processing protein